MNDVKSLLENWGRWNRGEVGPASPKCGIAIIMAQNVGAVVGLAPANDDDAGLVERVMRVLKQRKPEHYAVLHAYYVKQLSTRQIAKCSPYSDRMAFDMLKSGEAWVEGALASSIFIA